jgi:hypothetical protein
MPITDAEVVWAKEAFATKTTEYNLARDYYHGRHDLGFATPKFNKTFGALFSTLAYNRCAPVVDAMANGLRVNGFQVRVADLQGLALTEQATAGGTDYSAQAMTLWQLGMMDKREGEIYVEAGITGDAYGVVWFDSPPPIGTGLPRLWPNRADTMRVKYDDDGHIVLAAKAWKIVGGPDDGKMRLTLYTPTEITRLITTGKKDELPKALGEFTLVREVNALGQAVINPVPHQLGRPPVVHYANNAPMLGDYGLSELRDIMPLQDALNKAIADMLVAMEYNAFPQRYATGIDRPETDEAGKFVLPWKAGPGEIWFTTTEGANFGSFDTSSLEQFLKVQDQFDMDIARVSHTPVHYLLQTGDFPSGEAQKTAAAPFTAKLRDRQRAFGTGHSDAMAMKFALLGVKEPLVIEPEWESAEPRSQREQMEMAQLAAQAGLPLHIVGQIAGLDPDQLAELEAQQETEALSQERALAQMSGQVMGQQIQQGLETEA